MRAPPLSRFGLSRASTLCRCFLSHDHGRSGKPPEYVREYVEYFSEHFDIRTKPGDYPRLWPIVQAHDEPRISPEELARVLEYGLGAKSTGVMMFTIGSVAGRRWEDGCGEAGVHEPCRRR